MRLRPLAVVAIAALSAAAATAGCASPRDTGDPPRAIVIFEPSRTADAETARGLLADGGWSVWMEPAGPVRRTRSSLAVYGLARRRPRSTEAADILAPLGRIADLTESGEAPDIERLPFAQPGPSGAEAVLWLADRAD